jgi:hypothetical protein
MIDQCRRDATGAELVEIVHNNLSKSKLYGKRSMFVGTYLNTRKCLLEYKQSAISQEMIDKSIERACTLTAYKPQDNDSL